MGEELARAEDDFLEAAGVKRLFSLELRDFSRGDVVRLCQ